MASEWPQVSLRDAGVALLDCDHRTPPAAERGYPYIAIPQMRGGRLDLAGVRRISREHFLDWTRKTRPVAGDVILSRRCNPGETAVVPDGLDCALGQNLVILRADGASILPEYLRWHVRSPAWWEQVGKFRNVGAVFDSLKCRDIPEFTLPLPPLSEQRAIAHILGTLDDKIELNRRQNETLEAIARALFKSWFVDFDPVRAKAEGRSPVGMDAATAALFPSRFEDSELGPVPEGWRVRPVGDVVEAVGGSTPSTKEPLFWDDGEHFFATPKDMSGLPSPVLLGTERQITDDGLGKISSGLLPAGTLLMSSRAPIGYLAVAEVPVAVNQGIIAMLCNGPLSHHWMLRWCEHSMETIRGQANGTTFLEISKRNFRPIPLVVPPREVVAAFDAVVGPLYGRVVAGLRESATLAATRDALLPKLLSGDVRVPEAVAGIADTQR